MKIEYHQIPSNIMGHHWIVEYDGISFEIIGYNEALLNMNITEYHSHHWISPNIIEYD